MESLTTVLVGAIMLLKWRQRFSEFPNHADSLSKWKPGESLAYPHPLEGGVTSVVTWRALQNFKAFNEKTQGGAKILGISGECVQRIASC